MSDTREVEPNFKASQGAKKAPPAAKKAATKAPAAKKAPAPAKAAKKSTGGVARSVSTVSKEGTQKCEFSNEVLPVTAFPTVRQADGTYVRGTVARKHLKAWRDAKKAQREKDKAAKAAAKANKAAKAAEAAAEEATEAAAEA